MSAGEHKLVAERMLGVTIVVAQTAKFWTR